MRSRVVGEFDCDDVRWRSLSELESGLGFSIDVDVLSIAGGRDSIVMMFDRAWGYRLPTARFANDVGGEL